MTDERKQISRRKALAAIGTVGVAAAGSGMGTLAYLSDEQSIESVFETGSLLVSVTPETIEFNDLDEGETSKTEVSICNTGTLPVRNAILKNISLSGTSDVAKALHVTALTYGGTDISGVLPGDANGNGIVDLHDVATELSNASLTDAAGADGLDKQNDTEGEAGECQPLVFTVQIDYSKLAEGLDDESVAATLEMRAEQRPLGGDTSAENTTETETETTPTPTPDGS